MRIILSAAISIALFLLVGCADLGSSPQLDPGPDCATGADARLNEHFGNLANSLYRLDTQQALFIKGVTDQFTVSVPDHPEFYDRQEIHDATTAIVEMASAKHSITALLDSIESIAPLTQSPTEWLPAFSAWRLSIEAAFEHSDALLELTIARAKRLVAISLEEEFNPWLAHLECRIERIGDGYGKLEDFVERASHEEWVELIPEMEPCDPVTWQGDWSLFASDLIELGGDRENPFWGAVGLHLIPEIAAARTGWSEVDAWNDDHGSLLVDFAAPADSLSPPPAPALVVLLPEPPLTGSYYRSLFLHEVSRIENLPAGNYRILLVPSFSAPSTHPIRISAQEETPISFTLQWWPFQSCSSTNGQMLAWVIDPNDGSHLSNPCDCTCTTELWVGSADFRLPLQGHLDYAIHSEATFQFRVSCWDRTLVGGGAGSAVLVPLGEQVCAAKPAFPDSFRYQVEGALLVGTLTLDLIAESETFEVLFDCSPDSTSLVDVTRYAAPTRTVHATAVNGQSAEVVFPPGATPESDFYIRTTVDRIF